MRKYFNLIYKIKWSTMQAVNSNSIIVPNIFFIRESDKV